MLRFSELHLLHDNILYMAHLCSYPTYRGIRLEEIRVVFIPTSYEQGNPKWTHSTGGQKKEHIFSSEWKYFILLIKHDVIMRKVCTARLFFLPTLIVYTLALRRPLFGRAAPWEWAPGKPGSIVVPVSWLVALKPYETQDILKPEHMSNYTNIITCSKTLHNCILTIN